MPVQSSAGSGADDDQNASFIHAARRAQLVRSATELIAEVGLARASTVRVAERAGVSRGVLTYHFRDRAELIEQVVRSIYDLGTEFLVPRLRAAGNPRDKLLEFIAGSVELYAAHPVEMAALTEIFSDPDGVAQASHSRHTQEMADVTALMRAGQELGQFRDFDVDVMYTAIRGALDGALARITGGAPADRYAAGLRAIFDAATRTTP